MAARAPRPRPPVIEPEPGGRAPAPGALRLVQQFVNTNDREPGRDSLASPDDLRRWCAHWTSWPLSRAPTPVELRRALEVREGLRWMAGPDVVEPPAGLDHAVRSLRLDLEVDGVALRTTGRTPLGAALAPVVDAARTAMADGTWARLKVCARDRCQWLFYDSSRNASSRWCATDVCGSREKAARAYRRGKDRSPGGR